MENGSSCEWLNSALAAGLALGALLGEWDRQPKREILIAARTRDQAQIAWCFMAGLATSQPGSTGRERVQRIVELMRCHRCSVTGMMIWWVVLVLATINERGAAPTPR